MAIKIRILICDIECAPAVVYTWDLKIPGGYISPEKIVSEKKIICVACKWLRDDDVYFFSDWEDGQEAMLRQVWDFLNQADAVLGYNSQAFDVPYLNTEFVKLGLGPPSPFAHIDLLKVARKKFAFMSNSLNQVTKTLGVARKIENEGFGLWVKVMEGNVQAQRKMEEYNCGDLFSTEETYERLLPWIPSHPSYAVIDGEDEGLTCPQCGGTSVEPSGRAYTAVSAYPRYLCPDCGKWLRGAHRLSGSELRGVS